MDYCKYVDLFYGNAEVDHFAKEGLASKWFYIKALCGNTIPHATLPFGKMSVGPYSGGYPTGYGTHYPNACGGIQKISDTHTVRGFSHLHQSGTGGIRYYYNYAVTTPFYGELEQGINLFYELKNEKAVPGYYSAEMNDIFCEFTVSGATAFHRYHFPKNGGRVLVDFSNDGLSKLFGPYYYGVVFDAMIEKVENNQVFFSAKMSGVKLYFCATFEGTNVKCSLFDNNAETNADTLKSARLDNPFGVVADFSGSDISVKISYSTISNQQAAKSQVSVNKTFEEVCEEAYNIWNKHLSLIDITVDDDDIKQRFYSCFYHSIVKPCNMHGETVHDIKENLVTDIATFWDQYKTVYPLIYTLYPEMGEELVKGIVNISRTMGKIPCSLGLTDIFPCEEQAKMLGIFALIDAYYSGIKGIDTTLIDECIERELAREDFKDFVENGLFERYTHILDTADACFDVATITENNELKGKLLTLAENWRKAYGDDGLLSENSSYYEGDRYTYSFRLHPYMDKRIELANGKENFVKMLDSFFGFGKESLKQLTYIGAGAEIDKAQHHRFEGFNNECDMETPYAYIYADRNDRTCEIVHASITDSFLSGKGGLPGNNDSGGLTSCYVWNVIGLFPATGTGEYLIGSPHIQKATLCLSSGKKLDIEVVGQSKNNYITDFAEFNGKKVSNFRIKTSQLMQGGKLTIYMK